jgi:SAM-dependent methyltransferase
MMSNSTTPTSRHDGESSVEEIMASQIAYYRAHAPQYDDWWVRERRHDLGEVFRSKWESEISVVRAALTAKAPLGDVLELAGGTGNWTVELARLTKSVTVVDASPETVAIAKQKVVTNNVAWLVKDIFSYRPKRRYDTLFFSFWLSHVTEEQFDQFWELVADCLVPKGRVFFVDNAHPSLAWDVVPELSPYRQTESSDTSLAAVDGVTDLTTGISTRLAADGATYDLVKIWRTPEALQSRLRVLGWNIHVATTEWAFIYGHGSRA